MKFKKMIVVSFILLAILTIGAVSASSDIDSISQDSTDASSLLNTNDGDVVDDECIFYSEGPINLDDADADEQMVIVAQFSCNTGGNLTISDINDYEIFRRDVGQVEEDYEYRITYGEIKNINYLTTPDNVLFLRFLNSEGIQSGYGTFCVQNDESGFAFYPINPVSEDYVVEFFDANVADHDDVVAVPINQECFGNVSQFIIGIYIEGQDIMTEWDVEDVSIKDGAYCWNTTDLGIDDIMYDISGSFVTCDIVVVRFDKGDEHAYSCNGEITVVNTPFINDEDVSLADSQPAIVFTYFPQCDDIFTVSIKKDGAFFANRTFKISKMDQYKGEDNSYYLYLEDLGITKLGEYEVSVIFNNVQPYGNQKIYTNAFNVVGVTTDTALSAVYNAASNNLVATLINKDTGKPIKDASVEFEINGNYKTSQTNSDGQAILSTKNLAPGTYTAHVSYKGTTEYKPSNTTVDFTVKTSTSISAFYDVGAKELVATLTNDVTRQPILGATIGFKINGKTYTVKTDNSGQSKLSVADLPLGTYTATISYGGNTKYNPSSADLEVPIKADTSINVEYNSKDKQLVATLTNDATGQPIKGATVAVVLNNVRNNLKTDNNGQVKVSTNNLAPDVYPATVSYAGNAKYNSTKTTLDVVIDVKTSISASYKDGILTATLTNQANGKGINGADLLVNFGNVKYTVKTNSNGQANVSTRDLAPGAYTATVSYNAAGSTSTTSIPIQVKIDAYFIVEDISTEYNTNAELTATLVNYATGNGIVGATVGFKVNGKSYTVKTDSNGQAKINLSGLNPGTYDAVVSYNGNTKYNPAKETFNVVVNKITTGISVVYDSQTNEIVATLINEVTGATVKGGTIGIFLNNVKNIIVTDMNGQSRLSLGNVDPNTFTAYVSYAGNTKYLGSSRTITPVENKIESYISTVYNKETDEVVATLINKATGKGIVGGTVSIVVNNARNNIKTDSNGQAKVSIADLNPNVFSVASSYAGNSKYTATSETKSFVKV